MRRLKVFIAVATFLGMAAPVQAQERYALAGREVAVYNLAGTVRVEAGDGREVTVAVARGGRDARELSVASGALGDRQVLRVIYPGTRVVYDAMGRGSRSMITVREDGTFGAMGRASRSVVTAREDGTSGTRGSRRVEVVGSGSGTEAHADLVVRVPQGAKLAVYLVAGKVDVANVDGELVIDTHAAPVETRGTRGALSIDVGSGGVRVTDAQGRISLDTGSGGITVNGVRGEKLRLDTGSGGIRGSGIEVGALDVDVGSGGVHLAGVSIQEGTVKTGSGSVELELRSTVRSLSIGAGSGGVRLDVPSNLDAELAVATGSGGVAVEGTAAVREKSRRSFHGSFGEGRGRIRIDTGSGGVRVRQM